MTLESIFFLSIAIILLTVKPGPGMLAIISRALNDGFLPAFMMALGIVTIQAAFFILSAFSFSLAEGQLDFLTDIMKAIGASYMFYLGFRGLNNLGKGSWKKQEAQREKALLENYLAGAMITLSNPFVILFYAAVVPGILDLQSLSGFEVPLACFIIVALNLSCLTIEAALANQVRESLKAPLFIKRINLFTSISFILIGCFFTYSLLPLFSAYLGFGNA